MSLLLPPFGAFIGKWFSIESLGALAINQKILGAFVIVAIAGGGAILSLLYFKVLGLLIARTGDQDEVKFEKTKPLYSATIYILMGLIILSVLSFPFLMIHYFVPVASQTLSLPIEVTTVWMEITYRRNDITHCSFANCIFIAAGNHHNGYVYTL